jgi:hypothetical protein
MKHPPAFACQARNALPRTEPLMRLPTLVASVAASPTNTSSTRYAEFGMEMRTRAGVLPDAGMISSNTTRAMS